MPVYHTGGLPRAKDEYESVLLNKYLGRPQLPSTAGYNNLRLMARMSENRGPYLKDAQGSKSGKPPNHPVKARVKGNRRALPRTIGSPEKSNMVNKVADAQLSYRD